MIDSDDSEISFDIPNPKVQKVSDEIEEKHNNNKKQAYNKHKQFYRKSLNSLRNGRNFIYKCEMKM